MFTREDHSWRIWRYYPSAEELATALIEAKDDEARMTLLSQEMELHTPELVRALILPGVRERDQRRLAEANRVFEITRAVARPMADARSKRGCARLSLLTLR